MTSRSRLSVQAGWRVHRPHARSALAYTSAAMLSLRHVHGSEAGAETVPILMRLKQTPAVPASRHAFELDQVTAFSLMYSLKSGGVNCFLNRVGRCADQDCGCVLWERGVEHCECEARDRVVARGKWAGWRRGWSG